MSRSLLFRAAQAGFTLVEMIVVVFLLALAMLGILAVFDAGARINKSETDVADAQGAVRYSIFQMTRVIRAAGAGGLFVTQAVLNRPDTQLAGIAVGGGDYDNVTGGTVTDINGQNWDIRPGTDMIEVRGVILSPLFGFDLNSGCGGCTGNGALMTIDTLTADPISGQHVNNDPAQRAQFATLDAHTAGASAADPIFVIVAANDDIHPGCDPQPSYNVGIITAPTAMSGGIPSFGTIDFANAAAKEFNNENPTDPGIDAATIVNVRRAGVLDDILYFVSDGVAGATARNPQLMQAFRRGTKFDVEPLADDVEDMQIAYGVDVNGDDRVTRTAATTATDTDLNTSTQDNGDEWIPNTPGETTPFTNLQFQSHPAPGIFPHGGAAPASHCPRLHSVMVALVAKSHDPDPTYRAPSAYGFRVMNVQGSGTPFVPTPAIYPTPPDGPKYRRRIQNLRINLRNYAAD